MLQNIMLYKIFANIKIELMKSWLGTILTYTEIKLKDHIISDKLSHIKK